MSDGIKELMIQQGYVPQTCTMNENIAFIIWSEINSGRDPCAGCNGDRSVCKGRRKGQPYVEEDS